MDKNKVVEVTGHEKTGTNSFCLFSNDATKEKGICPIHGKHFMDCECPVEDILDGKLAQKSRKEHKDEE
jgi:hypothetical protein